MKGSPKLTQEAFLECNWKYEPEQNHVFYDKLHSSLKKIAMPRLYQEAIQLKNENNFYLAIIILTFLNNKYKQLHDRENEIKSLFNIAEYHEYLEILDIKIMIVALILFMGKLYKHIIKYLKKIETITM